MDFLPDLDELGPFFVLGTIVALPLAFIAILGIWNYAKRKTEYRGEAILMTAAIVVVGSLALFVVLFMALMILGGVVFRFANPSLT